MAFMLRRGSSRLFVVAGLLGFLPSLIGSHTPIHAAPPAAGSPSPVSGKRWVTFDLRGLEASGELSHGKPVELAMAVGGFGQGHAPLLAICESVLFQRHIVTLEPDPGSMVMKATATLEPIPHGKLSVMPKVARVQVTFARSQKDKLERVMTRIVYVTLGKQDPTDVDDAAVPNGDELNGSPAADQDEVQPDVAPMATGRMVEEDLLPLPTPGQGRAYWQQISLLVSRSWSRTARRVRHAPSGETVRVRFRLYPSGRAQLIEIEKGSGAREVDEAGIFAVVHAQPFPPFPDDIGTEPVDVHVRMRTGVKIGSQETRSVTNPQPASPNTGSIQQKK